MSPRFTALAAALIAIVLVVAQDVAPGSASYHTWQYALALAVAFAVVAVYANSARRGDDGRVGRRLSLAMAGAAVVIVAGLASGLLGPDTARVIGTPGAVIPLPGLRAAAFFAAADAVTIERGTAGVVVRRRSGAPVVLEPAARRVFGESLLALEPRPAAFVDAWDVRGNHLTVTQPNAAAFLSPVLLFRDRQRIGALDVPFDTFATPGRRRVIRALFFTPKDVAGFRRDLTPTNGPAVILTASDDAGHPLGITLAASGKMLTLGGLRLRVTVGTYPALTIAAVPPAWALVAGIALFVAGCVWSAAARPNARAAQPQRA